MKFNKYKYFVETNVAGLTHQERVALCLICCTRLAPLYLRFSQTENWGNTSLLTLSRELAVNWIYNININPTPLLSKVNTIIPESEEFGSVLGSYAFNASASHAYLLELVLCNKPDYLLYVLQNCYDTIDLYVQELLDPDCIGDLSEDKIENHIEMINEVNWQLETLRKIKGNKELVKFIDENTTNEAYNFA